MTALGRSRRSWLGRDGRLWSVESDRTADGRGRTYAVVCDGRTIEGNLSRGQAIAHAVEWADGSRTGRQYRTRGEEI